MQEVQYVTEKEVHQITRRALSTLRNERHLGKGIPFYKVGRSVRYLLADVLSFMERHRREIQPLD